MDARQFDAITRVLAQVFDRRQGGAAALALTLALLANDAIVKKKGGKGGGGKGGGGKGGGHKNKNKHKRKKRKKKNRGGASRDCNAIPLQPGADLHECDLRAHPQLASADFTDAKLEDTILSGADLTGVSFRGARLWRARLDGANLTNADFSNHGDRRTDIFGVDFSNANLDGANLPLEEVLYAHYARF
jgi:hypothetical protein